MAQKLRAFAALPENWSSVPSTQAGPLTNACILSPVPGDMMRSSSFCVSSHLHTHGVYSHR